MYPIFLKVKSIIDGIRVIAALSSHINNSISYICLKKFDGEIPQTSGTIAESKWIQKSLAGAPFSGFRRLLEVRPVDLPDTPQLPVFSSGQHA